MLVDPHVCAKDTSNKQFKMKQKHSKNRAKPYKKPTPARRNERFSKNYSFIQRSKQMEESHRRERMPTAPKQEYEPVAELLPEIQDDVDETGFYEQLVTGFNNIPTSDILSSKAEEEEDHFIAVPRKSKPKKEKRSVNLSADLETYNSFSKRFDFELSTDNINDLIARKDIKTIKSNWSALGNVRFDIPRLVDDFKEPDCREPKDIASSGDLQKLEVKASICGNAKLPLTALQSQLFYIANNYQDVYFPHRTHGNAEDIRYVYCLHALNHMLKVRSLILRNNEKVSALAKTQKVSPNEVSIPESFRDQGLKRMKVVFVVPFRESALKIVNIIGDLLFGSQDDQARKTSIANYERFLADYSGNTIYFPKTNPKPVDYEQTFSGNTDDNFKLGIRFTKKTMSLFSDMNSSDMLIASPLGLRMLVTDKESDFDFLNSIELLIMDQAELFLAQNWENLLHSLDHLHLQPQKLPDTNCQRVRTWCLSGASSFYRQTLFFSSHELPEFRAVINSKCNNYQGKARVSNLVEHGDIRNVLTPIQQVFRLINCSSVESTFDDRFQYFVKNIMPQFSKPGFSHCMLYVPSYFDYVRIRNHFKTEMVSFVQINEYTKKEKISRARDIFFHSGASVLLYSERAHFFRRTRIKGIRNLIMYQPPNFPHFYSEMINLMLESNQNPRDGFGDAMSVSILYTKYDLLSLSNIVGSENAVKLTSGKKDSYLFSTKT
ncbi:U3 small nucleolar RNA-associated protein 25 homolog [Drosophila santomea]|uniref:U3 small nucleolar RNA-associated protein 25 homolog n=1 Tax=Drosophila santomea TaxID=129105 RepID=UPI001954F4DE|nr:U3 small nucleolar RNA-associated protein 25 homolog [Drosophila santomea]XP_043861762.1 U3 small nucleolar RNA-associated protein 25 homolog [Drosophila santomea]